MTPFNDLHPFEDLQQAWEAGDPPPPPPTDLRERADHLDRALRSRDRREMTAVVAVALFFVTIGAFFPSVRGASLAVVGATVWIVGVLVAVRRAFPSAAPSAPLREAVAAQHRWLRAQVVLLRWAGLWYVLPVLAALLAFDAALGGPRPILVLAFLGLGVTVVHLNWKAADELAASRDAFAAHLHALDDA